MLGFELMTNGCKDAWRHDASRCRNVSVQLENVSHVVDVRVVLIMHQIQLHCLKHRGPSVRTS